MTTTSVYESKVNKNCDDYSVDDDLTDEMLEMMDVVTILNTLVDTWIAAPYELTSSSELV